MGFRKRPTMRVKAPVRIYLCAPGNTFLKWNLLCFPNLFHGFLCREKFQINKIKGDASGMIKGTHHSKNSVGGMHYSWVFCIVWHPLKFCELSRPAEKHSHLPRISIFQTKDMSCVWQDVLKECRRGIYHVQHNKYGFQDNFLKLSINLNKRNVRLWSMIIME